MQVGKDAVVIEADAIKNRDVMYKHLSSNDFTRNDPLLSSYVHEYSTKAAEMLLAAAGTASAPVSSGLDAFLHVGISFFSSSMILEDARTQSRPPICC
jgi:hypothetical protein